MVGRAKYGLCAVYVLHLRNTYSVFAGYAFPVRAVYVHGKGGASSLWVVYESCKTFNLHACLLLLVKHKHKSHKEK